MIPDRSLAGERPADQDRAAYLQQVGSLLWPAQARATATGGDRDGDRSNRAARRAGRGFIAVPGADRPRLLVPSARRAASAAVRRYGEPGSVRMRAATRLLSLALRAGAGGLIGDRVWLDDAEDGASIGSYLRQQLGSEICVSMHLGAARANRKPVLQLLTPDGTAAGFAKLGVNALTKELVQAEHDALTLLGRHQLVGFTVPAVLRSGSWRDLEVLVLSPLPVWQRRTPLAGAQLTAAMRELALIAGTTEGPLRASGYWQQLTGRQAALADSADARALGQALAAIDAALGRQPLCFGSWHGDWTPWNMASVSDGLLVWDWERFTTGVPVGFDALHHWLQSRVVSAQTDPVAAAKDCVDQSPALLAAFGPDAGQARLTGLLYLADLAIRYLADRQGDTGIRLGSPGTWLIPALLASVADLADSVAGAPVNMTAPPGREEPMTEGTGVPRW